MIIEEPCIGKRKHYSPYRCEFVPADVILKLLLRYPKLSNVVFIDEWKKYLGVDWLRISHYQRESLRKQYYYNIAAKRMTEILQRNLNYEKSTVAGGHIMSRAGRIWRNYVGLKFNLKDHTFSLPTQSNKE